MAYLHSVVSEHATQFVKMHNLSIHERARERVRENYMNVHRHILISLSTDRIYLKLLSSLIFSESKFNPSVHGAPSRHVCDRLYHSGTKSKNVY